MSCGQSRQPFQDTNDSEWLSNTQTMRKNITWIAFGVLILILIIVAAIVLGVLYTKSD